jgi:hypothetical protein
MLSYSGCYHSPMSRYKHAQVNVIERINFNLAIMLVLFICRCGGQHILVFIEYNIKYKKKDIFRVETCFIGCEKLHKLLFGCHLDTECFFGSNVFIENNIKLACYTSFGVE